MKERERKRERFGEEFERVRDVMGAVGMRAENERQSKRERYLGRHQEQCLERGEEKGRTWRAEVMFRFFEEECGCFC